MYYMLSIYQVVELIFENRKPTPPQRNGSGKSIVDMVAVYVLLLLPVADIKPGITTGLPSLSHGSVELRGRASMPSANNGTGNTS
jgi:hypothetical protein